MEINELMVKENKCGDKEQKVFGWLGVIRILNTFTVEQHKGTAEIESQASTINLADGFIILRR